MYLIDTNVISEARKGDRSNAGVRQFFREAVESGAPCFVSSITIGEIQRGISLCNHRGDQKQGLILQAWLDSVLENYASNILPFCKDCAQLWGHLCSPDTTNIIDKQLAATALCYDLTVVTRNVRHVAGTGVRVLDPFN
ncbi:type II toxin-antitoxin system VapC family toxin [Pseudohongiella spirulinae]|uniref:PilT protein domain protein n=1 Tax=Pseudohongiella spirulinae TaxID=1249552 RepID=A0A0S2KDN3_9GAMM|nr:type II toxin-antitoxin system VapC family toxin [Pseudohongiella spirulinae]ALO46426.1 PilT protein domain protein [Pseudohongiella spirulinae]